MASLDHSLGRIAASILGLSVLSCSTADDAMDAKAREVQAIAKARASDARVQRGAATDAYFGDLHIHSRWSFDAYSMQVPVGPEEAYRYARGEAIPHISGKEIRMTGPPLDFMALTEHGTYMGVSASVDDPNHPLRRVQLIRDLTSDDPAVVGEAISSFMISLGTGRAIPELVSDEVVTPTWRRIVDLADRNNVPGQFTSFVAYEYTTMPDGQNLHRNVIFRGSNVPSRPFSSIDSQNPEDLWQWMERAREAGDDVLAIPHNANGSNGLMYSRTTTAGQPIDAEYAAVRMRNEPISEVIQIKGQSETHPVLSPNDEWADFELFDRILGRPTDPSRPDGSYARGALKAGLEMEQAGGFNPYRFGMIGASDGHNASSPTEEDNYTGKLGVIDGTPEARMLDNAMPTDGTGFEALPNMGRLWSAAGLAGVWAESNTREALFDAMRARETFATSGPRIRVRLFAGFDFTPADLGHDMLGRGYRDGVPMGGELEASTDAAAPTFLVRALKDPLEAPLERLQIVKGWVQDGRAREKVFDLACADGVRPDPRLHRCASRPSPPNLDDCSYDPTRGSAQMSAWWADPEFDPAQRAFYYARVLQIPTCRWSTFDAHLLGLPLPTDVPASIQERAITSPVWIAPAARPERASLSDTRAVTSVIGVSPRRHQAGP